MRYLVRALPVTGSKWQYIGSRATLKAAHNLCDNTARATGRTVALVDTRTWAMLAVVLHSDVTPQEN